MNQEQILRQVDDTIKACAEDLETSPDFADLRNLIKLLHDVRDQVAKRWPLTVKEQQRIFIGPYAVRVLDNPHDATVANRVAVLHEALRPDIDSEGRRRR